MDESFTERSVLQLNIVHNLTELIWRCYDGNADLRYFGSYLHSADIDTFKVILETLD